MSEMEVPKESQFTIGLLEGKYALCQLDADQEIPERPKAMEFWSCTVTDSEISVVCPENECLANAKVDRGWKIIYLDAKMSLDLVGVLSSLLQPLKQANVSIFALSTFDTDYLLIRERQLATAKHALTQAGYRCEWESESVKNI